MKRIFVKVLKNVLWNIYGILKIFLFRHSVVTIENPMDVLMKHFPDSNTSAICNNEICTPVRDLTVIIPVYNVEKYLEKCLVSVLEQKTKYNFNVIAINDGSTDRSAEILNSYKGNEKLIIINQKNKGISGARNTGLKKISSNYVMFVDSDDFLEDDAIETMLDMSYKTDADILQGGFYLFDNKTGNNLNTTKYTFSTNVAPNSVLVGMPWGKVYKANLFENICFPEGYWFEDSIVTSLLTHLAKSITTIPEVVYGYRQRRGSITKTSVGCPKSIDTFWVLQSVLEDRKKFGMVTDNAYYDHLLRQTILNAQRIKKEPEIVQQSVFLLTKDMMERERPEKYVYVNKKYYELDRAILEGNYKRFNFLSNIW